MLNERKVRIALGLRLIEPFEQLEPASLMIRLNGWVFTGAWCGQ